MKSKTLFGFAAATVVTTQVGSAGIVLAGWHEFIVNSDTINTVSSPANEGVTGIFDDPSTVFRHTVSTDSGGSTDNYYGPDSAANGGLKTNQTPYVGPNNDEVAGPLDPRLGAGYTDPGALDTSQPGTTMNGRVAVTNDSDLKLINNSAESYELESFIFDAFLGDTSSAGASADFADFTVAVTISGSTNGTAILPIIGYTGVHTNETLPGFLPGTLVDTPFAPAGGVIVVPNAVVYGSGTNYVDYLVSFASLTAAERTLQPGDSVSIRFNQLGNGNVRIDNAAFTAVPEPSSALALAGLLGLGLMSNRRRR